MLDVRDAPVREGTNESKFIDGLREANIPFRFGEIRAGNEKTEPIFILDEFAVSFKPLSIGVQAILAQNKIRPQVWHESEINKWDDLGLRRSLMLHK